MHWRDQLESEMKEENATYFFPVKLLHKAVSVGDLLE